MAHRYLTLQHWNQWLAEHELGQRLLDSEQHLLTRLLNQHHGQHAVLIGVQHQSLLLNVAHIAHCSLLSPLIIKAKCYNAIETTLDELPILTGSIDLAILPHMLEIVENPRQLLIETCRIIKPEGYIAIIGFNPYSLWGLKRCLMKKKNKHPIFPSHILDARTVKQWLSLADFSLEQYVTDFFRPPITQFKLYEKLSFLEGVGKLCWPMLGGIYLILARAKVIPLQPIRLQWKQPFSDVHLPASASHVVRQSTK